MPIENEVKYLLKDPQEVLKLAMPWRQVKQGYLPGDARVRSVMREDFDIVYFFTYKIMTAKGLIEIEVPLSDHDADALWPMTTKRVNKRRGSVSDGDVIWDIDVFYDGDSDTPILAMAECEMPEGWDAPLRIDPLIEPFVIRAITREEQHLYTNVRLSDPDYARALYG